MRSLLIGLILSLSLPSPGIAWGDLGHETVAEIAERQLSESAHATIEELLGPGPNAMKRVAVWADHIVGERPETGPWHIVHIQPNDVRYDRARDCADDNCIVEKIKQFARVVGDRTLDKPARIEALKFLIHFVGDLHTPFHAYAPLNRPKGTWIRIGETVDSLHLWWDDRFVPLLGDDAIRIADKLIAGVDAEQRALWIKSTPEDWANESHEIAHKFVLTHDLIAIVARGDNSKEAPTVLPTSAINDATPIVARRLRMAGVRLAWLLNEAFRSAP